MDDKIIKLMPALHKIAKMKAGEINNVKLDYIRARETMDVITRQELLERMENGGIPIFPK